MLLKKKKKKEQEVEKKVDVKKDDEVALLPLVLVYTEKNMKNCVSEEVKKGMLTHKGVYCPIGTADTVGMILFASEKKRKAFYEDLKDFLDLGVGETFIFAKKQYVPEDMIDEAEENWNLYYKEDK